MFRAYHRYYGDFNDRGLNREVRERLAIVFVCFGVLLVLGVLAVMHQLADTTPVTQSPRTVTPIRNNDTDFDLAMGFVTDHDYGAAVATFSRLIEIEPQDAASLVGRAVANALDENHKAAIQDLLAAEKLSPSSASIQLNLAYVYEESGDLRKALQHYTRALETDPALVSAYGNRSRCYFFRGDYAEAIADISHVVRLAPDDAVARLNRAIALGKIEQYRIALADLAYPSVQAAASDNARKLMLAFLAKSGLAAEGLAAANQEIKQTPHDDEYKFLAALALNELSQKKIQAETDIDKALEAAIAEFDLSPKRLAEFRSEFKQIEDSFQAIGCCEPRMFPLEKGRVVPAVASQQQADEAYDRGIEFLRKGDFYTAVALLSESLRNAPDHRDARHLRSLTYLDIERLDWAEEDLNLLAKQYPNDSEIRTLTGMVRSRQGRFEESLAAFDHAVRIERDNPVVFANRALVKFLHGQDFEDVIRDCERAERLGHVNARLLDLRARAHVKLEQPELAMQFHQQAIEIEPQAVSLRLQYAQSLRSLEQLEEASESLSETIAKFPTSAQAHFELASIQVEQKNFAASLKELDAAMALGFAPSEAGILRSKALFELGRHKEAAAILKPIAEGSSNAVVQTQFAECLYHTGDMDDAWKWIQQGPELASDDPGAMQLAGQIAFARSDFDQAYKFLSDAVSGGAKSLDNYCMLGKASQKMERWKESIDWLGKALQLDNDFADGWYFSGIAFEEQGDTVKSLRCYSKCLALQENNEPARIARARVFVSVGAFDKALEDLTVLSSAKSKEPQVAELIATCHANTKPNPRSNR